MGRLTRLVAVAALVGPLLLAVSPARVAAFSGFGTSSADATYGRQMTFSVQLRGGAPDRLELLLDFEGSDATFVAPVSASGDGASYTWDAARDHVTPNTEIRYRWRAIVDGAEQLSPAATLLYDDDRPGLDWQAASIGDATVHWYGDAADEARRFGELSSDGARAAEQLLGHQLAGPIDIFVYDSQEDFFGALGPGAREWTGAATYPEIRTIFMWLGASGGDPNYLPRALVHEVTHVVFNDATDNPFHEPPRWLNEGLAAWSEQQNADAEWSQVEFAAGSGRLFAFPAIAEQFPIDSSGSGLAYAEGATMVDTIIERGGREAIARLAAAYRDGASDAEAIQAAVDESPDALFGRYFADLGVNEPQPVVAEPLKPSIVGSSPGPVASGDGGGGSPTPPDAAPAGDGSWLGLVVVGVVLAVALVAAAVVRRRSAREGGP